MSLTDDLQAERVQQAVEAISADHVRVVAWLLKPLATFGGKIAIELMVVGRTDPPLGALLRGAVAALQERWNR